MLQLKNADLSVAILDPANPADQKHLGTRYCWGGYIWQVTDATAGPLLAGAEWPVKNPIPFIKNISAWYIINSHLKRIRLAKKTLYFIY